LIVVGGGTGDGFIWNQQTGPSPIPDLPGGNPGSSGWGISADGSIVAGRGNSSLGTEAFRWEVGGPILGLGDLPGGVVESVAWDISADGLVIVGSSGCCAHKEATIWTEAAGLVSIGDLPGGALDAQAMAVSGDGSIVVGEGTTDLGGRAFIWDATNGMRQLDQVLADTLGLDLEGWTLIRARGVSDDGLTIIGQGINPSGEDEGWIAFIPEPSTSALLALGLVGIGVRGRHARRL
jgi:uncharacterized membrane protein